jgi:hypothetical protein
MCRLYYLHITRVTVTTRFFESKIRLNLSIMAFAGLSDTEMNVQFIRGFCNLLVVDVNIHRKGHLRQQVATTACV